MNDPLGLINQAGGVRPIQPPTPLGGARGPGQDGKGPSFRDVLMENIDQVNALQQDAAKAIEDLQTGRRDDVANVLMAKQKADTAFKLLLQVRNKLTDAYDEMKQIRV